MVAFEITEWHKQNKNDWCAINKDTNELIDRDDSLTALNKRMVERGIDDFVYCSNWFRPAPRT